MTNRRTFPSTVAPLAAAAALLMLAAPPPAPITPQSRTVVASQAVAAVSAEPVALVHRGSAPAPASVPLSPCTVTDHGKPILTGLRFDPPEVDVTDHAQTVRVIATGADTGGPGAATGIQHLAIGFPFYRLNADEAVDLTLAPDGTYVGRAVIPRGVEPGARTVDTIEVGDRAGNYDIFGSDAVHARGLDATLTVRSGVTDTRGPTITSFAASRITVDTRDGAKRVRFTAHLLDPVAGVAHVSVDIGYWRADLRLVSGTASDGTWAGKLTLPRWFTAAESDFDINLFAQDAVGNYRSLPAVHLRHRHLPSVLHLRARPDTTGPTLRIVRQSAVTVDARTHSGRVVLTVRAVDRGSGVETVGLGYGDDTFSYVGHRVAGNRHRGTWRVAVAVPYCNQPAGTSRHRTTIGAWDALGHLVISDDRLQWTTLTSDTRAPRHADFSPRTMPAGTAAVLRFGEDVAGISDTSAPVRPFDPDTTPDLIPPPPVAGSWACVTSAGAAVDCATGPVRTARWTPASPLPAGQYQADLNPEHVLELTDMRGNAPTDLKPVFTATA